jgi:hypothetical protein
LADIKHALQEALLHMPSEVQKVKCNPEEQSTHNQVKAQFRYENKRALSRRDDFGVRVAPELSRPNRIDRLLKKGNRDNCG